MAMTLQRRKLSEEIADQISEKIRAGEYKPEDSLPSERDLMQMFGVGRAAVREALFTLHKSGFLKIGTGRRARVSEPTPEFLVQGLSAVVRRLLTSEQGIRAFQETRMVFEAALCRRAAKIATAEEIEAIRSALDSNRRAPNLESFQATDVAFHLAIAKVGKNQNFVALNDALLEWLVEQRQTTGKVPDARKRAIASHTEIYEAIAARDEIRAMLAMEQHLTTVNEFYWRVRSAEEKLRRRHERDMERVIELVSTTSRSTNRTVARPRR
jgi:GntR family transcriptional repressor for pyruvate dehydrogenase complex